MSSRHSAAPRVVVVGAGSIGGAVAAVLRRNGVAVEIVTKRESLAGKIRDFGIEIRGRLGEFTVAVPAVASVAELSGRADMVLLAVKAQDMVKPAHQVLSLLDEQSVVVSLQNGITLDSLGEIVGRGRLVGCVVGWNAIMEGEGSVRVASKGSFVVGRPDGTSDPHLQRTQELLSHILPTRITANIYGALYSKLMINACTNSVGALTGLSMGPMLKQRGVPEIFRRILREASEVAQAAGIEIEPYSGQFNLFRILSAGGPLSSVLRGVLSLLASSLGYGRVRMSTLQSLERGRPTEIDWLNGYIVDLGHRHGVETAVNRRVVEMVKEIEQGKREIGTENLAELL